MKIGPKIAKLQMVAFTFVGSTCVLMNDSNKDKFRVL